MRSSLQQVLFHVSGINPAAISLAKRLGLGQLSWSESQAWGTEKRKENGREKEWESLGRAVCRRGDSWWQRRIRGYEGGERQGGLDVLLSHRPPLWPRRSDLRTGRLTKASEAARRKTRCKQRSRAVWRAGSGESWRYRPARLPSLRDWFIGWRGVCGRQSQGLTPPHLGQWTKGPPAIPQEVAEERRQTVAKRPPVIPWLLWFDPDWRVQRQGLKRIRPSPTALLTTTTPTAKSLPPPRAPGQHRHVFTDLFCSIKLHRTPCHISL